MAEEKPKVVRSGDRRKGTDPNYAGEERRVGERRATPREDQPK